VALPFLISYSCLGYLIAEILALILVTISYLLLYGPDVLGVLDSGQPHGDETCSKETHSTV
jgi:hypothetical protein